MIRKIAVVPILFATAMILMGSAATVITHPSTVKYVAASNSSALDKISADVICDGTDDQADINTLISEMTSGGVIKVYPGEYNFDTLTVDPNWADHYYGIGFPATQTDTYPSRCWIIEGTKSTMYQQWLRTSGQNGAIFNVTSTAMGKLGGTDYAHGILQCKGYNNTGTTDWISNQIEIRNITVKFPTNQRDYIYGIDLRWANRTQLHNCFATFDNIVNSVTGTVSIAAPTGTAGNSGGFVAPVGYCDQSLWSHCLARGWAVGYDLPGELITLKSCGASQGNYPIYWGYQYSSDNKITYNIYLEGFVDKYNIRGIYINDDNFNTANDYGQSIYAYDHKVESWVDSANLQKVSYAEEKTPGSVQGYIVYTRTDNGASSTSGGAFWEAGSGINVQSVEHQDLIAPTVIRTTIPSNPVNGMTWVQPRTNDSGGAIVWQYNSAGTAWVPVRLLGNITLYVDASGTNDLNHGTAVDTDAFDTLTYALACVPKNIGSSNVTINIDDDTFTDTPAISGFSGSGTFTVNGTLTQLETGEVTNGVQGTGASRGTILMNAEFSTTAVGDLVYSSNNAVYRTIYAVDAVGAPTDGRLTVVGIWPSAKPSGTLTTYRPGTVIDGEHTRSNLFTVQYNTCPIVINNLKIYDPVSIGLLNQYNTSVAYYRCHIILSASSTTTAASINYTSNLLGACFYQCYFYGHETYAINHLDAKFSLSGCLIKCYQKGGTGKGIAPNTVSTGSTYRLSGGTTIDTGNYGIDANKDNITFLSIAASGYCFVENQNTEGVYGKNGSRIWTTNVQYSGNTDDEASDADTGTYIGAGN